MDLTTGFTIVELLLFLVIGLLIVWIITLELRLTRATHTLRRLFAGRSGIDLEQVMRDYIQRMDRSDQTMKALGTRLDQALGALGGRTGQLEALAPGNVQHVGVVRYNPFPDKGGDQSFAVALLDDRADGVVFNGLHSRTDARVYAKPVVGGASTYPLTEEEKQAIQRAMNNKKK